MKTKKVFAAILIIVLVFLTSITACSKPVLKTVDKQIGYEKLVEKGFPEYVIDEINDLAKEKALSYDGTFDSATVQYYSKNMSLINQLEFENGKETKAPSDGMQSSALNLTILVINLSNGDKALILNYEWKITPFSRWTDVLGLQWDFTKWYPLEDSFYKANQYVIADKKTAKSLKSEESNSLTNSCPSGVIWEANLKGRSSLHSVTALYGIGAIVIRPYGGGGRVQGGYIHRKLGIGGTLDFGTDCLFYNGSPLGYDQMSLFRNL